jgi:probable rRNA maturation factor
VSVRLHVDGAVRAMVTPDWRAALRRQVGRMTRAAALHEGRPGLDCGLTLTDDPGIHALNRDYRHKDKPTDVLAFAQREGPGAAAAPSELGDIVISLPTARRQAKRRGQAGLHAEVMHLAAHGLCHLLGYDHRTDREEATMNARATALLAQARATGRVRPA